MSTGSRKHNKQNWMVQLAALGVGAILGYSYYRKISKPLSAGKPTSLTIDTSNIKMPKDIDQYFSVALSAAYEAGNLINKFINDRQSKSESMSTKANIRDLVTEFDQQCEDIIIKKIKSNFPTHKIIAEESCVNTHSFNITDEPTWYIDPIDGTTNFVHGIPFCCVCIGLRINKVVILGIVHCPVLNETFHAILGQGSYVINHTTNKKMKLQTNSMVFNNDDAIKQALIITGASSHRSTKSVNILNRRLNDLLYGKKVRAIRMIGSCAIDMVWIAMGRADIFYIGTNDTAGPKPWDYTAAEIIVSEAGGVTCLPEGKVFDCTKGRVLCCNNVETAKYIINMGLYKATDYQ